MVTDFCLIISYYKNKRKKGDFMDIVTILLWIITLSWFIYSIKKDKKKTFNSVKTSSKLMKNMIGEIIAILMLIGIILSFIPPEIVKKYLGDSNIVLSTIIAAIVGSITLIPAFVAFPLVGSFIDIGANIIPIVAFLTTLTMVGFVTFPLERKEFGFKFSFVRNILSFGFAIIIALLMGVFY